MRCVVIVLVVISGYLLLDFPHVYHAKTSSFCSFPDKNFAADPKIEQSQITKSMVFATLSQTCYHKTRTKNIGKRKPRNVVLLTKTSQNTGFSCLRPKNLPNINDTPRAAADARASCCCCCCCGGGGGGGGGGAGGGLDWMSRENEAPPSAVFFEVIGSEVRDDVTITTTCCSTCPGSNRLENFALHPSPNLPQPVTPKPETSNH